MRDLHQLIPHRERRPSDFDHVTVVVSGPGCAFAALFLLMALAFALAVL